MAVCGTKSMRFDCRNPTSWGLAHYLSEGRIGGRAGFWAQAEPDSFAVKGACSSTAGAWRGLLAPGRRPHKTGQPPRPIAAIASGKPRHHSGGTPGLSGGVGSLSGEPCSLSGCAENPSVRAMSLSGGAGSLSVGATTLSGKDIYPSERALGLSGRGKNLSGRAFCTIDRGGLRGPAYGPPGRGRRPVVSL